jgi:xylulokinase
VTHPVLGIDVGLSSVKAAVVGRDGRLLGRGRVAQPPLEGAKERFVADWTDAIPRAVRAAMEEAGSPAIDCIGLAALGPCPVLLDGKLSPIGSVPLFSLDDGAEAERQAIRARTGIPDHRLGPDHAIPRLLDWQRTRPREIAGARVVVDATGCLVAWLTGRPVMDPATRADHVCEGLEQPVPLPEIAWPTKVTGRLTASAARMLSLGEGVPVAAGTYDSFADFLGMGIGTPGQAGVLLGSTVVLGALVHEADPVRAAAAGLRVSPYVFDGSVLLGGWTSASGSLLDWADRVFEATPSERGSSLLALPYFSGERAPVWDAGARGVIAGLSLSTTRSDLRAAMTEAVALSILDIADRLQSLTSQRESWHASGGGVRNGAWLQATADALGAHLEVVKDAGEAIGPAALALDAIGHSYEPVFEARDIEPDMRRHERYREKLAIYRRLYPALREAMHDLNRLAAKEKA